MTIDEYEGLAGAKAENLRLLYDAGLRVPSFEVLLSSEYDMIEAKSRDLKFPIIIRSSSSLEDGAILSFAGVFHSSIAESYAEVAATFAQLRAKNDESIQRVAREYNISPGHVTVSYILQEYKLADRGGVMIVPSEPDGQLVVESGLSSSDVTDGSYTPEKRCIPLTSIDTNQEEWLKELQRAAQTIQGIFSEVSQEVEWLIADETVYVVQARPYSSKSYTPESVLAHEKQRISTTAFHQGCYDSNALPDIARPTPLTLELIARLFATGRGTATSPVVVVAGTAYLDRAWLPRQFIGMRQLWQLALRYKAFRSFRSGTLALQSYNDDTLSDLYDYIGNDLAQAIFKTTDELQAIQQMLMRKLKIKATHRVFGNAEPTPFQKEVTTTSLDEMMKRYWYVADNEYELSAARYSEQSDSDVFSSFAFDEIQAAKTRKQRDELCDTFISVFDSVYCRNLFQIYDQLCINRAMLHDRLINVIAKMRMLLLAVDREKSLYNTIWFATFDEILHDRVPDFETLQYRQNEWRMLQTLPLPDLNELKSWDDLALQSYDGNTTRLEGIEISPGIVEGVIGDSIMVVDALTQNDILSEKVRGVVTERGGSLSHVAVLARERGIVILRVDSALNKLKIRDRVVVDTEQNAVIILEKDSSKG